MRTLHSSSCSSFPCCCGFISLAVWRRCRRRVRLDVVVLVVECPSAQRRRAGIYVILRSIAARASRPAPSDSLWAVDTVLTDLSNGSIYHEQTANVYELLTCLGRVFTLVECRTSLTTSVLRDHDRRSEQHPYNEAVAAVANRPKQTTGPASLSRTWMRLSSLLVYVSHVLAGSTVLSMFVHVIHRLPIASQQQFCAVVAKYFLRIGRVCEPVCL